MCDEMAKRIRDPALLIPSARILVPNNVPAKKNAPSAPQPGPPNETESENCDKLAQASPLLHGNRLQVSVPFGTEANDQNPALVKYPVGMLTSPVTTSVPDAS